MSMGPRVSLSCSCQVRGPVGCPLEAEAEGGRGRVLWLEQELELGTWRLWLGVQRGTYKLEGLTPGPRVQLGFKEIDQKGL